jgi:hypothetical protein
MTVLIGADPEILLIDADGAMRSVEGMCGGTKDAPVPIPGMRSGYAMQEDNVMLEFNIPPQRGWGDVEYAIGSAIDHLEMNVLKDTDVRMFEFPSAEYCPEQLATAQASTFGCSPDLDAYENDQALGVTPSALGNFRCAGGHIHLGYENKSNIPPFVVAQLSDALIGLWEPYFGQRQGIRRKFYGTAGRYRVKPYGIEYRTPSNRWLFNMDTRNMMMRGAQALGYLIEEGNTSDIQKLFTEIPRQEIARAINMEDMSMARDLSKFINTVAGEIGCEL